MRIGRESRRETKYKICPRCGLKSLSVADSCQECGLIFSRLALATNKDAKRKMARGDKDFIIMTSNLPSDIKWYKLLLMTIFLGLFGGHCFYVGRYWRGGMLLVNGISLILYVVFNAQLVAVDGGRLIAALTTIGGIIMLFWIFDVIWVIIKKFKVPVAIDLESEISDIHKDMENENTQQYEIIAEENIKEENNSNEDSSRD